VVDSIDLHIDDNDMMTLLAAYTAESLPPYSGILPPMIDCLSVGMRAMMTFTGMNLN